MQNTSKGCGLYTSKDWGHGPAGPVLATDLDIAQMRALSSIIEALSLDLMLFTAENVDLQA